MVVIGPGRGSLHRLEHGAGKPYPYHDRRAEPGRYLRYRLMECLSEMVFDTRGRYDIHTRPFRDGSHPLEVFL